MSFYLPSQSVYWWSMLTLCRRGWLISTCHAHCEFSSLTVFTRRWLQKYLSPMNKFPEQCLTSLPFSLNIWKCFLLSSTDISNDNNLTGLQTDSSVAKHLWSKTTLQWTQNFPSGIGWNCNSAVYKTITNGL